LIRNGIGRLTARLVSGLALIVGLAGQAGAADGVAGPYLAGRAAAAHFDYAASAQYYTQALIADPNNPGFLENALLSHVATGRFDRALPMLDGLDRLGLKSQIATLLGLADAARAGDWDGGLARLDGGETAGPLVDGLYRAWALVGQGRMSDATAAFDRVSTQDGMKEFALYHKALALSSVGDFEGADAILSGAAGGPLTMTRRGVIAHAQVLSQLERAADALALLDEAFGPDPDPAILALRADLAAGKPVPFDVVATAGDGVAEVLYTVSAALVQENQDVFTLAYARLAYFVRPAHLDAILLTAEILEAQDQFDLASEAYNLIPQDSPAFHAAEMGRADALVQAGRTDAAIEALQQLAKSHSGLASVWSKLGDVLRQQERFAEAEAAYDEAIATFAEPQAGQWVVYYARGIAKERQKLWDQAVADFRKALELSPDQPHVLNYLGYGFLEQKTNYDEALSMIEKAVAARPQDGYIVDSLGWALYRLGRYDEAVGPMEQAVELMPVDPIVNDHLGDVYWAVGRVLEAEFQWKRALSFEPETEDEAARIRRKLEVGLDAVLAEEGAAPLSVSENGN
jgi:tetratricopeptide (TPR) repeat protein